MSEKLSYDNCKPSETCPPEGCEECEVFNRFLMEGDRLEASAQDKAFMQHWERKGEGW